ncbi:hypothetical protein B0H17DRAFT_1135190 [Mycena rosella]|uniref:Uncharacterized protein n=1 Tax=Mycena rosella TaxID=1033263 RepID=A0AAD7DDK3_MYCRO|nr:hypothetical protein B0H17DRAFT_1135190 [Mycena rosella]
MNFKICGRENRNSRINRLFYASDCSEHKSECEQARESQTGSRLRGCQLSQGPTRAREKEAPDESVSAAKIKNRRSESGIHPKARKARKQRRAMEPLRPHSAINEEDSDSEEWAQVANETIASKVLSSMYRKSGGTVSPLPPSSPLPPFSPLPPSSPPSPETPPQRAPHRAWASPEEWDDPGSPLPPSAYERMPWARLFVFGPKGGPDPDADELT